MPKVPLLPRSRRRQPAADDDRWSRALASPRYTTITRLLDCNHAVVFMLGEPGRQLTEELTRHGCEVDFREIEALDLRTADEILARGEPTFVGIRPERYPEYVIFCGEAPDDVSPDARLEITYAQVREALANAGMLGFGEAMPRRRARRSLRQTDTRQTNEVVADLFARHGYRFVSEHREPEGLVLRFRGRPNQTLMPDFLKKLLDVEGFRYLESEAKDAGRVHEWVGYRRYTADQLRADLEFQRERRRSTGIELQSDQVAVGL